MRKAFIGKHLRSAAVIAAVVLACVISGCKSPAQYHKEADRVAGKIITETQKDALGREEPFTIERPEETLRRRLIEAQGLHVAGPESLGTSGLDELDDWPEKAAKPREGPEPAREIVAGEAVRLSLFDALEVAASNSRDYQSRKEDVFRTALDLDLARDGFRSTFAGMMDGVLTTNLSGDKTENTVDSSHSVSWSQLFENGTSVTAGLAVDLVKLLTGDHDSSLGIAADTSLSVPLLRGAGKRIVREPLTQAERNVVYAIYSFERYKRTFVVRVASDYLSVLESLDQVANAEENYRSLVTSGRRARRLRDAGRLPEIQVDQARQDELRARERWIFAIESYKRSLDNFKVSLGLPTDADIALDPEELGRLASGARDALGAADPLENAAGSNTSEDAVSADAPVDLDEPSREGGGPYEIEEQLAVGLALENRLDLRTSLGQLYDAQRKVVVAADGLKAGLDVEASGSFGSRRSGSSAGSPNAELRPEKGVYNVGLYASLPLERTSQRNSYRASIIAFERSARDFQEAEDQVKLEIRNGLRDLLRARESIKIQIVAVRVAKKRVDSAALFLDAGRAEIRDLLEAQESLVSAQNALTSSLVDYRVAALALQRDMGVLEVDEKGIWREYDAAKFQERD